MVVYQVKDTIFWKQITTILDRCCNCFSLFIKSKIQFFESKSQLYLWQAFQYYCCLSSQRYNFLKANHNIKPIRERAHYVVYQVKDTIFWKQITTLLWECKYRSLLFIKSKIQFFESKSQLISTKHLTGDSCLSSQRYNFLKANHNVNQSLV